jgi:hypothetical protein
LLSLASLLRPANDWESSYSRNKGVEYVIYSMHIYRDLQQIAQTTKWTRRKRRRILKKKKRKGSNRK